MRAMIDLLEKTFVQNSLLEWLIAASVVTASVFILWLIQHFVSRRLTAFSARTATQWDDIAATIVSHTKFLFLLVVGIVAGAQLLELPPRVHTGLSKLLILSLLVQIGIWGVAVIVTVVETYRQQAIKNNPAAITTIGVVGLAVKIILWSTILLVALDNMGVNITALVAGLGIGGVAVALAVQNILGDLFASLSIVVDKPFVIGDFIILGDYMGSVEHIGLKTTRVRSLSGEQLVFSNSDLLSSRIRNYGRMFERRVVFSLGVIYETPREKLKRIPEIIRNAVESQDNTRFDRSHFMKYADFSLQFETVYYVLSPDYNIYMDIQQAIYFTIHERFEAEEIEFAYPTQKLFVEKTAEAESESEREAVE